MANGKAFVLITIWEFYVSKDELYVFSCDVKITQFPFPEYPTRTSIPLERL